MGRTGRVGVWWNKSHRFFKFLCAALVICGLAMWDVDGDPPASALGSDLLWRLEVGLAVMVTLYAAAMLFSLGYAGKWVSVPVPGTGGTVGGGENIDDQMDSAATSLSTFQEQTKKRLDDHDDVLEEVLKRLTRMDGGGGRKVDPR